MSGPKVVNIQAVRRRQRREGLARLRELGAVLEECFGLHEADPGGAGELRRQVADVLARLEALRAEEQWAPLLAQAAAYAQIYRDEAARLRRQVSERRAATLRREHHRRRGGAGLREELEKLPASTTRDAVLRKLAAAGDDEVAWSEAAGEAAHWLAESQHTLAPADVADFLRQMTIVYVDPSAGEPPIQLPGVPPDPEELRLDRCWALLAELEPGGDTDALAGWKHRVQAAAAATDPDQRGLQLDSLALEITSFLRERRGRQAGQVALQSILAEIEGMDTPEASAWCAQIEAVLDRPSLAEEMQALAEAARVWVVGEQSREDAREQRVVVLRGLASLGYEVREGMAAAWMEGGRVVVHRPGDGQYGVELSAPAAGDAFQARVVAAPGHSAQRDREMEETWCTEFARLRGLLAAEGFTTDVVRALAPGAVPVKTAGGDTTMSGERRLSSPSSQRRQDQAGNGG